MLWFIGLGISGFDGVGANVRKILKEADVVYFESFTSPISKADQNKIKKLVRKKFADAPRWFVEDGKTILDQSRKKKAVLLAYGDPYIATTHIELRTRAKLAGISTRTIHAASAIPSLVGECGLQYYKIGRPVTLMSEKQSWNSVYYTIYDNLVRGLHSILILEFNSDAKFFLNPRDAFSILLSAEEDQRRNVVSESTFGIVASRIGSKDQHITSGRFSNLAQKDFGRAPHTIIIPGRMHFTEADALKAFSECLDEPSGNDIQKISDQMILKYIPKARKALDEANKICKDDKSLHPILENAQLYIDDAERFQREGKEELAILSIGYAEGLIDALRLSRGIDPWT